MKNLKSLNLNYTGINHIDGLSQLVNLETLNALSCRIDDIESLSNLINLKYLRLEENEIKDITPLKNLKKLEYVNIMYNQIADLSPLQGIEAYVSAYGNEITLEPHQLINGKLTIQNPLKDVDGNVISAAGWSEPKPIQNGEEIIWDNIANLNQVSFDFYKGWKTPNPEYIDCSFVGEVIIPIGEKVINQAPSISFEDLIVYMGEEFDLWSGVTAFDEEDGDITHKLRVVENNVNLESPGEYKIIYAVHDSKGESITEVRKVTVVKPYVDIPDSNLKKAINYRLGKGYVLTEIKQSEMETLEFLSVNTDELVNLEGIQFATNLKRVILGKINNIEHLQSLTNLTQLTLSSFESGNIEILGELTNLNYLIINHSKEIKIDWLESLKNLKTLYLLDGNISDLTVISSLTNLETLSLSNQSISDITPLQALKALTSLNLSNNLIKDITPLKNLSNLEFLQLNNNLIEDITGLENLSNLVTVELDYNKIKDISSWNNNFTASISSAYQEINLEEVIINSEDFSLSLPIKGFKNESLEISNISHQGNLDEDLIEWSGLKETTVLSFDFSSSFKGYWGPEVYSGTVNIPIRTDFKPKIEGAKDITIKLGDSINLLEGITASDQEDGDLTSQIEVIGEVDTNQLGSYEVTYRVKDSDNNEYEVVINVHIISRKEDLNQDGIINELDLEILSQHYNISRVDEGWNSDFDMNEDEIIDLYDVILISSRIEMN